MYVVIRELRRTERSSSSSSSTSRLWRLKRLLLGVDDPSTSSGTSGAPTETVLVSLLVEQTQRFSALCKEITLQRAVPACCLPLEAFPSLCSLEDFLKTGRTDKLPATLVHLRKLSIQKVLLILKGSSIIFRRFLCHTVAFH